MAFKLAAALSGDQEEVLARYCDLLCLGTVADVMPLVGENRYFVAAGIQAIQHPAPGGTAGAYAGVRLHSKNQITAGTVGYLLAHGSMRPAEWARWNWHGVVFNRGRRTG